MRGPKSDFFFSGITGCSMSGRIRRFDRNRRRCCRDRDTLTRRFGNRNQRHSDRIREVRKRSAGRRIDAHSDHTANQHIAGKTCGTFTGDLATTSTGSYPSLIMLTTMSPFLETVNAVGVTPVNPLESLTEAPLGSD